MRKILVVLGVCAILTCMPMLTASPINFKHRGLMTRAGLQTGGTFEGLFAEKNETGYNILGTISGTYEEGINWSFGTLVGVWAMNDGSASGDFSGNMIHSFFFGQYNVTGGESNWFIGLFRTNETTNEFQAISIVFGSEDYLIRYGIGNFTETN